MVDNKVQPDPIVRLYNNIKSEYDLPDFNTFKADMSDSNKAKRLHNTLVSDGYDVPEYDVFSVDMGLKKKAANLQSSGIPSLLPKEPDFLQQGQKVASGEIFTDISKSVPKSTAQPVVKTTLKEAALKDKENNNSYLGAQWNNVVASAQRLAGGAAWLAQKFDSSPVSRIQEAVDKAASSVTGINYEAQREKEARDKITNFIGKARSNSSSKEYEQRLTEGFDVTNGIGLDDLKGLGAILPSMLVDIGAGTATGGASFAIQGYDDALSTIDSIPEGKYMSETTRTAFGFGGAIISGVLEKLGMDNILKSGTATKYVTSKILKETAGELAKKGVKVTAEQFEKAVANKATQMLTKTALKNTVKAGAKSALAEGATEATQEGAMDLMKLAANQLEGSEIFDEEELKNTAASRYLNAAAMGGIFGGGLGSISSRTKNVQQHIEDEVKNAKTQEDIAAIIDDINENVKDGTISENDAEVFKSIVDENINKPSTLEIENEKETKLSDIDEFINSLDKNDRLYNDKLNELNKEKNEIISYYDDLSKKSQKDEETSFDDGKVPTEEIVTEEVKPTEVKTVEQLRKEEQVEYDSMTDPNDEGKKKEIYEKYDKLISPLLEKPIEQKVTVQLLSSEEPPQKEGQNIVTLSGKTEAERLASIEKRQASTQVSDKVLADNAFVQKAQSYFKKDKRYKNTPEGRAELNRLRLEGRDLGFTVDTESDKVTVPSKKTGRPTKVRYNNRADSDAVVESNVKTLTERNRDVQDVFEELTNSGVFLDIKSESGNRMSAAQIDSAISDILEGIPSKAANKYLDALEKGLSEDAIPLYDKGMGGFAPRLADIRAELGVEKEVVGEPMDDVALNKFLDEESKLTPEEEQDLLDNVENLLYEYETTEEGPQREVQPIEARAEEGVSRKTEPVAEVKKTGKVAKPVKEAPKEAEIAKEYKEAVNKASKKAKENAKKDFVDRNFDNLVEKLKIQIKCPT